MESIDGSVWTELTGLTKYLVTLRSRDGEKWEAWIDDGEPVRRYLLDDQAK